MRTSWLLKSPERHKDSKTQSSTKDQTLCCFVSWCLGGESSCRLKQFVYFLERR
jgi:hypothetical protein